MQSVAMPLSPLCRLDRLILLVAIATAVGCASNADDSSGDAPDSGPVDAAQPDAAVVPVFRNPVDMPDDQLAAAVLARLGAPVEGAEESCNHCHGLTQQRLRGWRSMGDQGFTDCITDLEVTDPAAARAMIDCLRSDPADPAFLFSPQKLGVYTTAADLPWFTYLFTLAHGAAGQAEHAAFVERVGMPRGQLAPLDQAAFDLLAEYFARDLPLIDDFLPNDPGPGVCKLDISTDVAAHVAEMEQSGWRALNAERDMLMHGCGGAATPRDCLADRPRASAWEAMDGAVVRALRTINYRSSYWTRSSPDGRFVAHGTTAGDGFSAAFVDLQLGTVIPAAASYDPGFFPDNLGFAFQRGGEALFCEEAVLTAGPAEVSFDEPGCASNHVVGLYQHLGAALGGGDYWTVDGEFESDDGGKFATPADPPAGFGANSRTDLTPMIHDGSQFVPGTTVSVPTAGEGDAVISPSARLVVTRVRGAENRQVGLVMRRVVATATPGGYEVEALPIARYCENGGKPSFSFDERWLTYHHYVGPEDAVELGFTGADDPAFAAYLERGAANVHVLDLLTGVTRRVTGMAPGEYALYPHFRSDGWIYFMVRTLGRPDETIAATDAALVLEE